ncbi:adenylate/guanylate cyclase domain-containing protein [Mycobacteriaceae bacterium NPDC060252]
MDIEPSGLDAEPDREYDSGIRKRRRGRTRGPVRHDLAAESADNAVPAEDSDATEPTSRQIARASRTAGDWFRKMDRDPTVVAAVRRARRSLPGDPYFGDPLSTSGFGGASAVARAADRLVTDRDTAFREFGFGALQIWQAFTEKVSKQPANREVTLVFTDLVGFSGWALEAGDEATLKLLRRVASVAEPPMLNAGGQVVKRMGDGIMAVFDDPVTALHAVIPAREALRNVEIQGYTPLMRIGIHTGTPQRIGSDWLGVDVNIAARVMESATKGGLAISQPALAKVPLVLLDHLGLTPTPVRRPLFSSRPAGVPENMKMYLLETRRELPAAGDDGRI